LGTGEWIFTKCDTVAYNYNLLAHSTFGSNHTKILNALFEYLHVIFAFQAQPANYLTKGKMFGTKVTQKNTFCPIHFLCKF
jgi:hypothetical protein